MTVDRSSAPPDRSDIEIDQQERMQLLTNRGKPARHCEAHSPAGERHGGRASRGRGRQGNEQDQGTAELGRGRRRV
jgi:hypothetical protein